MSKPATTRGTPPKAAPIAAPAADRTVTSDDNAAPEAVPASLASVADLPAMMKGDIEKVTTDAVLELDTFSRVPATIESDEIYDRVTTLATRISGVSADLDKRRSEHKAPYLAAGRVIDDAFKLTYVAPGAEDDAKPRVLKTELEAAHKSLKGRLSAYDTLKHNAAVAAAAEAAKKLADAAAADGIELGDAPIVVQSSGMTKSAHGGAAVKNLVKVWRIVVAEKLPRSLLMPDEAKIKAMVDGGAKSIPGIEIEEVVDTHVRRR